MRGVLLGVLLVESAGAGCCCCSCCCCCSALPYTREGQSFPSLQSSSSCARRPPQRAGPLLLAVVIWCTVSSPPTSPADLRVAVDDAVDYRRVVRVSAQVRRRVRALADF